jgi:asparagine synthetase B (glutamine-hydrolysing)
MSSTFNNWFKFGFNNDTAHVKRMSSSDKFFVEFENYQIESVLPIREAFEFNNLKIQEHAKDSEIYVMLSGGYDSQSIAKTMVEDNIKFTALIFDFGRNINAFDVEHAKKLCNEYNIPYKVISFDLIEFYRSGEFKDYANLTHCNNQLVYSYMRGMRDIKGTVVSGHGDQEFYFKNNEKFWQFSEQNYCLYEYVKCMNLGGFIRYHEFTKKLWYSSYEHYWKKLTFFNKEESYKIKTNLFTSLGLEERQKYTGFETYTWPGEEYQHIRHQTHKYLLNNYPSSQDDVSNLRAGKPPGDLFLVKTPVDLK